MLHDVVPSEIASTPPDDVTLFVSVSAPTITSGPVAAVHDGGGAAASKLIEPLNVAPVDSAPAWIMYAAPAVTAIVNADLLPQPSSLQASRLAAVGQPEPE